MTATTTEAGSTSATATEINARLSTLASERAALERDVAALDAEDERLSEQLRAPGAGADLLVAREQVRANAAEQRGRLNEIVAERVVLSSALGAAEAREEWDAAVSAAAAVAAEANALCLRLLKAAQNASDALADLRALVESAVPRGAQLRQDFRAIAEGQVPRFHDTRERDTALAERFLAEVGARASLDGVRYAFVQVRPGRAVSAPSLGTGMVNYGLGITGQDRRLIAEAVNLPPDA